MRFGADSKTCWSSSSLLLDLSNLVVHWFGGVDSGGVPPDPISNSEVKPACGKSSTGVARRKRSTMPPFNFKTPIALRRWGFCFFNGRTEEMLGGLLRLLVGSQFLAKSFADSVLQGFWSDLEGFADFAEQYATDAVE